MISYIIIVFTEMPRTYKPHQRGKRQYLSYSPEMLEECIESVKSGALSINKASKTFNIPRGTIQNKMKNIHPKSVGPPTTFTRHEEELFMTRVITMCNWGFPLDKLDLRMMVAAYLTKQNRIVKKFKDNIPGEDWVSSFMKRNGLTNRIATNIRRKRAQISKEQLQEYFENIKEELDGVPPSNIWNYDETNLRDDPGARKYVMKRGTKYPERIMDSSKVAFSVMFTGNAEGAVLPPYVVYKSVHLYDQWVQGGPPGARYNRSKSGWFDETTFTDWFFKMMLPKLRRQEGKKVLIGNNLSSHLSESVIQACSKNNIAFICLFPNATHMLQPLDVAWFAPLKKVWRKTLEDWKKSPNGLKLKGALPKEQFNKLLKTLVSKLEENGASRENLIGGFRKCGLYPFDPKVVYERLPSENIMSPRKALDESLLQQLQSMRESPDGEETTQANKRTRLDVAPGKSISNLTLEDSDSESEESEPEVSNDSNNESNDESSDESSQSSDPDENDVSGSDVSDNDNDEEIDISDINIGDFALVKYKYSRSIKFYIGECMEKDQNGEITFIFLERVCGSLFKYRENVIRETAHVSMIKQILPTPTVNRRGGKLEFKSSKEVIDHLRYLY